MPNAPYFPRRSHRPKSFNFLNVPEEVKTQRAALLEAKRLSDEAVQAKAETAKALVALEAEETRKADMSRQLAKAKQREAAIAEALHAANAVTTLPAKTKVIKER